MKRMYKATTIIKLSALWLAFFLSASITQAQPDENQPFKLEVINLASGNQPELFFRGISGDYEALNISTSSRGRFNLIQRKSPLVLYREVIRDGETVKEPALSIKIPIQDQQAILFFFQNESEKAQYRIIPDSPDKHPGGSLRIVNLTNQEVVCLVDQKKISVAPFRDVVERVIDNSNKFSFAFAALKPTPYRSPTKKLPMRSKVHRLMIVFSNEYRELPGESEDQLVRVLVPDATRMYDRVRQ